MSPMFLAALTLFLGLVVAYLTNQLPGFKNFPGKNAFIFKVLAEVVALMIILNAFSNLSEKNDPKNIEWLAWLQGGAGCIGAFLVFDCCQTGLTARKHYMSGVDAGIDDEEERLKLLKSMSQDVLRRQEENFRYLSPQVVIPVGLQNVPTAVGRLQPIATEDSQPKLLLNLQRFFRLGDRPIIEISTTQRLIDVFDQAGLRLLILGKPGAGKTTLLLELAEQLLEEAQQSGCDKIPIILECSKWKDDSQPLSDWLILQLENKGVPSGLSRRWIKQKQLVPLLDGLDELGLERQQKATNAISKFIKDNDYPAMVVCCRQEEWQQAQAQEPQEKQFGLNGAVYLEPLTDTQIKSHLQEVQRPRLWEHIQSSGDLKALLPDWDTCKKDGDVPGLRSPLLLNMLLVAYKEGQPIRSQSELFQSYIKEQFIRHGKSKYTEAQTRRYLTWLARQLKVEKATEFEIENLQPSWLNHIWQLWIHQLISGLIYGLVYGLVYGLAFGPAFGLAVGLVFGLALIGDGSKIYSSGFSTRRIIQSLISELVNSPGFSARRIMQSLISGLVIGIIFGIMLGLIGEGIARVIDGVTFGLIDGVNLGLVVGLMIGVTAGVSIEIDGRIHNKMHPNEGIWNIAESLIFINIVSLIAEVLIFTLYITLIGQPVEWKNFILYCLTVNLALSFGLLNSLIQYGVLRLLLWANGSIPWNYATFLDHANKLRLVQSMGGRYRFVHDLLREEIIASAPSVRRLESRLVSRLATRILPWIFIGVLAAILLGIKIEQVSPKVAQTIPILYDGDLVFFDQYSYRFIEPQRDDLVSFQTENSEDIKHEWIVGLPGETISSKDNQLLIDGEPIDLPYTSLPENFSIKKPFHVPAQSYFVVGELIDEDGKTVSNKEIVPRKQLNGRWLWRLWPLNRFGSIKESSQFIDSNQLP